MELDQDVRRGPAPWPELFGSKPGVALCCLGLKLLVALYCLVPKPGVALFVLLCLPASVVV